MGELLETLNPERYAEFKRAETECHSHNLQMAMDLMKEAPSAGLTKFVKTAVKEYNKENNIRHRNPIAWKKEWNMKTIKETNA